MAQTIEFDADHDAAAATVTALIEHGIPADIIELLVRGSLRQGIKPGALSKAIKATILSYRQSEVIERAAKAST